MPQATLNAYSIVVLSRNRADFWWDAILRLPSRHPRYPLHLAPRRGTDGACADAYCTLAEHAEARTIGPARGTRGRDAEPLERCRGAAEGCAGPRDGIAEDVALRIYTTRLLGGDPLLVLHGGGNTSVKTRMPDLLGEMHDVLCVKGSGWDMGTIEAPGLPAVKLAPLRTLRSLERLSDEDMVNFQRLSLLDASAPNPSVETLLHAFLPHKFVDHTHAAAVLSLVDQPDGEALAAEVYDGAMGFVPYVIPGFKLAKLAADVYERNPDVEGLILHKHGIFTFGADAREAYERMIAHVSRAEARLAKGRRNVFAPGALPSAAGRCGRCCSADPRRLRGAGGRAGGEPKRFVLDFRTGAAILNYVNGADVASYSQRGVVTPDHIIRTKNFPLLVPPPEAGRLEDFAQAVRAAVAQYAARYDAMFARQNSRVGNTKTKLDAMPRVVLVPGVGLFGIGATAKDAAIAADLAENTVRVITDAEAIGSYEALGRPISSTWNTGAWSRPSSRARLCGRSPARSSR